jgi:hypothetical protein
LITALALVAGPILLAGCSGPNGETASVFGGLLGSPVEDKPPPPAAPAPTPVATARAPDSSCGSAAQCKHVLKTMIESPDRGWIGQQQSPDTYANGTRLFAYRALRKQLTCGELSMAVQELRSVSRSLDGSVEGMSPDQVSRTRALCTQVHTELTKEREGRCRT